jgi:hypothetical protein
MLEYSNGSVGPSTTVQYNGLVEASMQGYNKGSVVPSITVRYNV